MPYLYIIYSETLDRYYIGATNNIADRLLRHNSDNDKYTSKGAPWKLVYQEAHPTKAEAMARERILKNKKSRKYIEWLIANNK